VKKKVHRSFIKRVQQDIVVLSTEVATETSYAHRLKKRINGQSVRFLDDMVSRLEGPSGLSICGFCLPGETRTSAFFDIARTTARKAERRAVSLKRKKMLVNDCIVGYLNRLSDILFLLARLYAGKRSGKTPGAHG